MDTAEGSFKGSTGALHGKGYYYYAVLPDVGFTSIGIGPTAGPVPLQCVLQTVSCLVLRVAARLPL